MTIQELRRTVFNQIGVDMGPEVFPDDKLAEATEEAIAYWLRYMLPLQSETTFGFVIDDSMTYTFEGRVPKKINALFQIPSGRPVPCFLYFYMEPILTIRKPLLPGQYAVCYENDMSWQSMDVGDLRRQQTIKMFQLICAYVKKKVGQFHKFASYVDKPFDGDMSWYAEAAKEVTEIEEFIRVNRDERMSNISDLGSRRRLLGF
jgi:hypothetical protein